MVILVEIRRVQILLGMSLIFPFIHARHRKGAVIAKKIKSAKKNKLITSVIRVV